MPATPDLITLYLFIRLIFLFINKIKLPREFIFLLLSFIIILFTVFFQKTLKYLSNLLMI